MGFNTFHSFQKFSSLDENFPVLSYLLLLMFLLSVHTKYLRTKLIFSHSSHFLLFSPTLVIFFRFPTLSNGMQLSNRILHSPRGIRTPQMSPKDIPLWLRIHLAFPFSKITLSPAGPLGFDCKTAAEHPAWQSNALEAGCN